MNALAPIEPFKLFHKINENVKRQQPELRERLEQAEMVSTMPPGRSPRPGGMAQLGYACFWPKGGGNIEGGSMKQKQQRHEPESQGESQEDSNKAAEQDTGNEGTAESQAVDEESSSDLLVVDPASS